MTLAATSALQGFSGIQVDAPCQGEISLTQEVQHLLGWWWGAGPGRIRRKDEFDILDHVALAPHISLVSVLPDGAFRIKVMGEELKQLLGVRRQGDVVTASTPDESVWRLHDHLGSVVSRRVPLRCVGTLSFADKEHHRFEALDCPLANPDGTIGHVAGVLRVVEPAR